MVTYIFSVDLNDQRSLFIYPIKHTEIILKYIWSDTVFRYNLKLYGSDVCMLNLKTKLQACAFTDMMQISNNRSVPNNRDDRLSNHRGVIFKKASESLFSQVAYLRSHQ